MALLDIADHVILKELCALGRPSTGARRENREEGRWGGRGIVKPLRKLFYRSNNKCTMLFRLYPPL